MTSPHLRFLFRSAAASVVLLTATGCQMFSGSSGPAAAFTAGSQVAEVHGGVRVTDASRQWRTLRAGDGVRPGDLIQTALESAADIIAGGGASSSRVLLQSDSVVLLEALPEANANELRLHLRSGWITLTSPATATGPLCEVRFAKGLVGAHGATFNIHANGHLKVLVGTVVVKLLDDQPARTIAAGTQFDPQTGEVTAIPAGAAMEPPAAAPASSAPARRPLPNDPFAWPTRPK